MQEAALTREASHKATEGGKGEEGGGSETAGLVPGTVLTGSRKREAPGWPFIQGRKEDTQLCGPGSMRLLWGQLSPRLETRQWEERGRARTHSFLTQQVEPEASQAQGPGC